MEKLRVISHIENSRNEQKMLVAQLLDPDFIDGFDHLTDIVSRAEKAGVDLFFFGGSLVTARPKFDMVKAIKEISKIPVLLFPSSPAHIDASADAILFLSLISGRNPEYLIGTHVAAAPLLKNTNLEIIPTGYILVNCGAPTTAEYISGTAPVPHQKPEIAAATALAGQMLGMKLIYLDGGSGAEKTISTAMIAKVREWVDLPIIVGGGIRSVGDAVAIRDAGADILVIGNGAQTRPEFITELTAALC